MKPGLSKTDDVHAALKAILASALVGTTSDERFRKAYRDKKHVPVTDFKKYDPEIKNYEPEV